MICPKGQTIRTPGTCATCGRPIMAYIRLECATRSTYRGRYKRARSFSSKFRRVEK